MANTPPGLDLDYVRSEFQKRNAPTVEAAAPPQKASSPKSNDAIGAALHEWAKNQKPIPEQPQQESEPTPGLPNASFAVPMDDGEFMDYLVEVGDTGKFAHPMAASAIFKTMKEAEAAGLSPGLNYAWRDPEEQARLFRDSPLGVASAPGHSIHEGGLAADFQLTHLSDQQFEQFRSIAAKHGLHNPWDPKDKPHEAHHFVYQGKFKTPMEAEMSVSNKKSAILRRKQAPAVYKAWSESIAAQAGIDRPDIFVKLIEAESNFDPKADSGLGGDNPAVGLGQVRKSTFADMQKRYPELAQYSWKDYLNNDRIQLQASALYFKEQLDRFKNYPQAAAAYNAGPGAIPKAAHYKETREYVQRIFGVDGPTAMSWIQNGANSIPYQEVPKGKRDPQNLNRATFGLPDAPVAYHELPRELYQQTEQSKQQTEFAQKKYMNPYADMYMQSPIAPGESLTDALSDPTRRVNDMSDSDLLSASASLTAKKFASGFSFGLSNYVPFMRMTQEEMDIDKWVDSNSGMLEGLLQDSPAFFGMMALLGITGGAGAAGDAAGATVLQRAGLQGATRASMPAASELAAVGSRGAMQTAMGAGGGIVSGAAQRTVASVQGRVVKSILTNPKLARTNAARWLLSKESPEMLRWGIMGATESFNRNFVNAWNIEGKSIEESIATASAAAMWDGGLFAIGVPMGALLGTAGAFALKNAPGPSLGAIGGYAAGGPMGSVAGALIGGAPKTLKAMAPGFSAKVGQSMSRMFEGSLAQKGFAALGTKYRQSLVNSMMKSMDLSAEQKPVVREFMMNMLENTRLDNQQVALKSLGHSIREQITDGTLQFKETDELIKSMTIAAREAEEGVTKHQTSAEASAQLSGDLVERYKPLKARQLEVEAGVKKLKEDPNTDPNVLKAAMDERKEHRKALLEFHKEVKDSLTSEDLEIKKQARAFGHWKKSDTKLRAATTRRDELTKVLDKALPELQEYQKSLKLTHERLAKTAQRLEGKNIREADIFNTEFDGLGQTPEALEVLDQFLEDGVKASQVVTPDQIKQMTRHTIDEVARARGQDYGILESSMANLEEAVQRVYPRRSQNYFKDQVKNFKSRLTKAREGKATPPTPEELANLHADVTKASKRVPQADPPTVEAAITTDPRAIRAFQAREFRDTLQGIRNGERQWLETLQEAALTLADPKASKLASDIDKFGYMDATRRAMAYDEHVMMGNKFETPDDIFSSLSDIQRHYSGRLMAAHSISDNIMTTMSSLMKEHKVGARELDNFVDLLHQGLNKNSKKGWQNVAKYLGDNPNTIGRVAEPLLALVRDVSRVKHSDSAYTAFFKALNIGHRFPRRARYLREVGDTLGANTQDVQKILGLRDIPENLTRRAAESAANNAQNIIKNQFGMDWEDFVFKYRSNEERVAAVKALTDRDITLDTADGLVNEVLLGGAGRTPLQSLRDWTQNMYKADAMRQMFRTFMSLEGPGGIPMIVSKQRGSALMGTMRLRKAGLNPKTGRKAAKGSFVDRAYEDIGTLFHDVPEFKIFAKEMTGDENLMVHPELAAYAKEFMTETDFAGQSNALVGALNAMRQTTLVGSPIPYLYAQLSNSFLLSGMNVGRTIGMFRTGAAARQMGPEVMTDFMRHGGQLKTFKAEFELVDDMIKNHPQMFPAATRARAQKAAGQGAAADQALESVFDGAKRPQIIAEGRGLFGGIADVAQEGFKRIRDVDEALMEPLMFRAIRDGQLGAWMFKTQQLMKTEGARLMSPAGGGMSHSQALATIKKLAADEVNQMSGALPRWWTKDSTRKAYFNFLLTPQWTGARISAAEGAFDGFIQMLTNKKRRSRFAHVHPQLRKKIAGDYKKFLGAGMVASLTFANVLSYMLNGHSTFRNRRGREWDIRIGDDTYLSNPFFTFHKQIAKLLLTPLTSAAGRDTPDKGIKGLADTDDWRTPRWDAVVRQLFSLGQPGALPLAEAASGRTMGPGQTEELRTVAQKARHVMYGALPIEELAGVEYNPSYRPDSIVGAPKMKKSTWFMRQAGLFESNSNIVREAYADRAGDLEYANKILRANVEQHLILYHRTQDPKHLHEAQALAFQEGVNINNRNLSRDMGLADGKLKMTADQFRNAYQRIMYPSDDAALAADRINKGVAGEYLESVFRGHQFPAETGLPRQAMEGLKELGETR